MKLQDYIASLQQRAVTAPSRMIASVCFGPTEGRSAQTNAMIADVQASRGLDPWHLTPAERDRLRSLVSFVDAASLRSSLALVVAEMIACFRRHIDQLGRLRASGGLYRSLIGEVSDG